MKKAGIAIDAWKLAIFERRLTAAGYTFTQTAMGPPGTLFLSVVTTNMQALAQIILAANKECARTGPPAPP